MVIWTDCLHFHAPWSTCTECQIGKPTITLPNVVIGLQPVKVDPFGTQNSSQWLVVSD